MSIPIDVAAARAAINAIRMLDLQSTHFDDIKSLLGPIVNGYTVKPLLIAPGLVVWRSRICDKQSHIRDLFYPPKHITKLGRANKAGNPVLYVCTSRQAPLFEAKPSIGATATITRWISTSPMMVNHVGYTSTAFRRLGSARVEAKWGDKGVEYPNIEGVAEVAEFLAHVFTQQVPTGQEHLYKLTATVAEVLLSSDMFHGLIYPAVAVSGNIENIALKPSYADTSLRFVKAEFLRVEGIRNGGFDVTLLDTASELDDDGSIRWKGHLDQWVLRNQGDERFGTYDAAMGEWVMRDSNGNVVPPE